MRRPRTDATERSNVDDSAVVAPKFIHACLGHEKGTPDVYREHLVPFLDRNLAEVAGLIGTGVVHK